MGRERLGGHAPGVLNDVPEAGGFAAENHEVVAMEVTLSVGGAGGEDFAPCATVISEIAGEADAEAGEGEVAVEGREGVGEMRADGRDAGEAQTVGAEEDGVVGVELEDGLELLGFDVADEVGADFGEFGEGCGIRTRRRGLRGLW